MDMDKVVELYYKGYNQSQIAKELHYSQPAVCIALKTKQLNRGRRMNFDLIQNPILRTFCIYNNLTIKQFAHIVKCSQEKAISILTDEHETRLSIPQIKRLLSVIGKTFEEVFDGTI